MAGWKWLRNGLLILALASACAPAAPTQPPVTATVASPTSLPATATRAPSPSPSLLATATSPASATPAATATTNATRQMVAEELGGQVEVQRGGAGDWLSLARGEGVVVGDQLRTGEEAYVLLRLTDRSSYVLGPDSLALVERLTPGSSDPLTTLFLQAGSALAVAPEAPLGAGAFEIRTQRLTFSLTATRLGRRPVFKLARFPSGYVGSGVVTIEPGVPSEQAATTVGCLSGNCSVNAAQTGKLTLLELNQYAVIENSGMAKPISGELLEQAKRLGVYNIDLLIGLLTGTPPAVPTHKAPTATPTPKGTLWTPLPTLAGATPSATPPPAVTHRVATPDPNWTPALSGMTAEEYANAGQHRFDHTCRPAGKCICSESGDTPTITLTFDPDGVKLSGGGADSMTYPKLEPNVYRLKTARMEATLQFYIDGWDFVVTQDGAACSFQTFLLK